MELQLQVTEEELLEFPEVRSNQINTSHTDNPAGKVVHSTEKRSSLQNSCRSHGRCSADTHSKIKVEKPYYRRPVAHRRWLVTSPQNPIVRQPVGPKVCRTTKVYFNHTPCFLRSRKQKQWSRKQKQKDRRLATDSIPTPSIFDIQVRPNLTAFAKTLTPEALRYLYLGIDLGWTIGNCPQ